MIRLWKLLLSAQESPGGVPAEVSASSIPFLTPKLIVESIDADITVYRSEKGRIVGSERSGAGHAGEDDGSRSFSGSFWRWTTGESSAHSLSKWGRTNGLSSTLLFQRYRAPGFTLDSREIDYRIDRQAVGAGTGIGVPYQGTGMAGLSPEDREPRGMVDGEAGIDMITEVVVGVGVEVEATTAVEGDEIDPHLLAGISRIVNGTMGTARGRTGID